MGVAAGNSYLVSGVELCQPVSVKVSHTWNSTLLFSRTFVNSLTTCMSKVNQVVHRWRRYNPKFLKRRFIKTSKVFRVRLPRWQQSSMDGVVPKVVEVEEAEETDGVVKTAEADAEPTTVGHNRVKVVRVALRRSGQPPTPGFRAPGTLTCPPSTRAGSTGTGGSLRDFVKNPGHAHGSHFITNLQIIKINETGTSPNHR